MVKFCFNTKIQGKLNWFLGRGDEIVIRTSRYSAGRSDMARYENVRQFLERAINKHNLTSTAHYFGSRVSGTSVFRSDIDFFIEIASFVYHKAKLRAKLKNFIILDPGTIRDNFHAPNSQEDAAKVLMKINNAINKSNDFKVTIFLPKANVPLLRVVYLRTDFECDIVATSGLSVKLCHIINHLNSIQPQTIPLFHYIRIWIHLCGINMKRYVQYLLIFFYLEQINYMPTIQKVQKNLHPEVVGDWQVQFDPSRTLQSYGIKKLICYADHILGYFKFYSKLNFEEFVLSIYEGKCIKRSEYKKYESFKIDKPLCVAGPLDLGFNSGQTVSKAAMEKFPGMCKSSFDFLIHKGWN